MIMIEFISYSIGVFLLVIILLVIILLVAKKYLSPSGNVNITVNGMASSCLQLVVERPVADSVRFRYLRVGARSSIPRSLISPVSRLRTTGAWVVSVRSRAT